MTDQKSPREMRICMGSSCFCRGNEQNVAVLQDFLREHGLEKQIDLIGSRCEGNCTHGPNLVIDGQPVSGLDPQALLDLLNERFLESDA